MKKTQGGQGRTKADETRIIRRDRGRTERMAPLWGPSVRPLVRLCGKPQPRCHGLGGYQRRITSISTIPGSEDSTATE